MAKNAAQQKSAANGAASAPAPESIDQVRDLLFGGQMRMVDSRLQNLDERMARETSAMRTEFDRQVAERQPRLERQVEVLLVEPRGRRAAGDERLERAAVEEEQRGAGGSFLAVDGDLAGEDRGARIDDEVGELDRLAANSTCGRRHNQHWTKPLRGNSVILTYIL